MDYHPKICVPNQLQRNKKFPGEHFILLSNIVSIEIEITESVIAHYLAVNMQFHIDPS